MIKRSNRFAQGAHLTIESFFKNKRDHSLNRILRIKILCQEERFTGEKFV